MESAGRRRGKRARVDDSFITAFTELRDSGIPLTGPKRNKGRKITAEDGTPIFGTGRGENKKRKSPWSHSTLEKSSAQETKVTPRTELAMCVRDLIEASQEAGEVIPAPPRSSRPLLTPTPAKTPRRSARFSSPAKTPLDSRPQKSALKSLHESTQSTASSRSRVSFGKFTVTEYSPDVSRDSTDDHTPSSSATTPPLPREEEEEEEEEMGEGRGEELGSEEEGVERVSLYQLEPLGEEDGSGGSEEEEEESDREIGRRLRTPRVAPQKKGKSPALQTPDYSDLRPKLPAGKKFGGRRTKPPISSQQNSVKTLPRSLIKNLFMLHCKRRVTKEAMDLVLKFSEVYLKQASTDIATFAGHASRKTLEVADVILLMKRQRLITGTHTFEYLANTHLPLEYVEELLPCAIAGKQVLPKMRDYS